MDDSNKKSKLITFLPILILGFVLGLLVLPLCAIFNAPDSVMEVDSPDGQFRAYVLDAPSMDPPNQSLYIEWADQSRFLRLAKLAGDIDSIKEILWSPDSSIVVFHSRLYLTIARVSDWSMIRVYLGDEWRRAKPVRRSTFAGAQPIHKIDSIEFPEPGQVAYKIDGQEKIVKMEILPE